MFVSHYEFIKYASACYYKYASVVPVLTFYSVILVRLNKKVLPLHNLLLPPPPQKNFFRLATSLLHKHVVILHYNAIASINCLEYNWKLWHYKFKNAFF